MTTTADRLKTELVSLSPQDRAELAQFLIRSLDQEIAEDVEAAWDAELARRTEEIERGEVIGEPANEVFARLRAKHS